MARCPGTTAPETSCQRGACVALVLPVGGVAPFATSGRRGRFVPVVGLGRPFVGGASGPGAGAGRRRAPGRHGHRLAASRHRVDDYTGPRSRDPASRRSGRRRRVRRSLLARQRPSLGAPGEPGGCVRSRALGRRAARAPLDPVRIDEHPGATRWSTRDPRALRYLTPGQLRRAAANGRIAPGVRGAECRGLRRLGPPGCEGAIGFFARVRNEARALREPDTLLCDLTRALPPACRRREASCRRAREYASAGG